MRRDSLQLNNTVRVLQEYSMYMVALSDRMSSELALQTKLSNDTLLHIARVKLDNGTITEYDYRQVELQCLNTQLSYEDAAKNYEASLRRLSTYLGISRRFDISVPSFNL